MDAVPGEGLSIMVEAKRAESGSYKLVVVLAMTIGLIVAGGNHVNAKDAKRRTIPVTINKGETYVISGVSAKETSPGVKVVNNPNALVVQNAPGKIVLVGADTGTWKLDLTLASGELVTYEVSVKALAPPQGSLNPVAAPTSIPQ